MRGTSIWAPRTSRAAPPRRASCAVPPPRAPSRRSRRAAPPVHLSSRIHLSNCSFPDDLYQKVLWKNIVHIKRYGIRGVSKFAIPVS